jgi:lipopolysaccharide export system permease protein
MRIPWILGRYLARETVQYTLLGLVVFSMILVSQNALRVLTDIPAEVRPRFGDLLSILALLVPIMVAYAVPVAFLFGVLLAMSRLASEEEIAGMRSCGVSLAQICSPVVLLGVGVSLLTAYLILQVEPSARRQEQALLRRLAANYVQIEPGRFHSFKRRVVYVRARDVQGRLDGVMIWDQTDRRNGFSVFAEKGDFYFDAETAEMRFDLENGDLHLEPSQLEPDRYRRIAFQGLEYSFDLSDHLAADLETRHPRDMNLGELRDGARRLRAGEEARELRVRDPARYDVQVHRRLALPAAPIFFAMLGVPLGIRRARGARSFSALLCVVIVFAYYVLLTVAEFLGVEVGVPAVLAMWLPNLAFGLVALWLLRRTQVGV